jgi:predicted nucleic acid-binding protein
MQAALFIQADLPLVTRDTRHFERIDALQAVQPSEWRQRTAKSGLADRGSM